MSAIDPSVFVDALVGVGLHGELARQEVRIQPTLQVPAMLSIFGAESTSALRGLVRRGDLSAIRAVAALEQVRRVRTVQYLFEPFTQRVWELRDNLTAYDAWYVALAEWLRTDLVTWEERLTNATGPQCRVRRPAPCGDRTCAPPGLASRALRFVSAPKGRLKRDPAEQSLAMIPPTRLCDRAPSRAWRDQRLQHGDATATRTRSGCVRRGRWFVWAPPARDISAGQRSGGEDDLLFKLP